MSYYSCEMSDDEVREEEEQTERELLADERLTDEEKQLIMDIDGEGI